MELHLERFECGRDFTIGNLSIDGRWEAFTIEDQLRQPGVKVPAQTCIPAGRYRVKLTISARFRRVLPILLDVPMFEGIRIHAGNTIHDTEGCILVGQTRERRAVGNSRAAFDKLFAKLVAEKGPIWITVDGGEVPTTEGSV